MSIKFKFLEAGKGDARLISVDGKNILVDGGEDIEFPFYLLDLLRTQQQPKLDLVILTHQDDDHLEGLVSLFSDKGARSLVQKIWFNSHEHDCVFYIDSTAQTSTINAVKFDKLVRRLKEENSLFTYDDCLYTEKYSTIDIFENTKMNLLSPTKKKLQSMRKWYIKEKEKLLRERNNNTSRTFLNYQKKTLEQFAQEKFTKDGSVSNGSSIAFILTYKNEYNFLLLADAHIDVIVNSLRRMGYSRENKLVVQLVKLSHHGSKHNINQNFLELIDTDTFVISTNGDKHNHPDAATLSKIILNSERNRNIKLKFLFNTKKTCQKISEVNAFEAENREKHNFSLRYLGDLEDDGFLKFG